VENSGGGGQEVVGQPFELRARVALNETFKKIRRRSIYDR
jgi:hypothetical protein